jgi:hypothetical protein
VSVKQVAAALALIFVIVLAVVVGTTLGRMNSETMAVVIGVVCGVAAGIPTAVLLVVALTRRDRQRLEDECAERQARQAARSYPPVVVIQGGAPQALPPGPQAGYWPAPMAGPPVQREFHVVGGDDLLFDDEH